MNSQMVLNFSWDRSWVNYSSLLLNFSLWVDTNPNDILYVEYYNSRWNLAAQYSGHLSTTAPLNKTVASQWLLPQLKLPTTTTMLRFRFSTGCCETPYKGVFIDFLGIYMIGPSNFSKVMVFGRSDYGASLSVPVSIDGSSYYEAFVGRNLVVWVTLLASPGTHTLTVPSIFSDGSKSYSFSSWDDGFNTSSRAVNAPAGGGLLLIVEFRLAT